MTAGRLPDFLVAGAMRSGTTSLYRYLGAHPGIYMAPKELGFFTDHYERGLDWYRDQFAPANPDQLLGEATADYLARGSAMERIAKVLPGIKLVASLRHPVDRAWSHYLLLRARGRERRPFAVAIDEEIRLIADDGLAAHGAYYLYHSLYDAQLRRAHELLSREQVHVSIFERMASRPDEVYRSVCQFLGATTSYVPANVGSKVNPYVTFRSLRVRQLSARLPGPARRIVARINTRQEAAPPPLEAKLRSRLQEYLDPHIEATEETLGFSIPEWKRGAAPT